MALPKPLILVPTGRFLQAMRSGVLGSCAASFCWSSLWSLFQLVTCGLQTFESASRIYAWVDLHFWKQFQRTWRFQIPVIMDLWWLIELCALWLIWEGWSWMPKKWQSVPAASAPRMHWSLKVWLLESIVLVSQLGSLCQLSLFQRLRGRACLDMQMRCSLLLPREHQESVLRSLCPLQFLHPLLDLPLQSGLSGFRGCLALACKR